MSTTDAPSVRRLLTAFLLLSSLCAAQNRRFDGVAFSRSGLPAPGASVAICSQTAITAISESGNTVTVTSTLAPPPINGTVTIFDVVPSGYNGTWTVLASSPTFFTFFNPLTGLGAGTSFGAAITSGSTACSTPVALCSSPTDGTCASPNPVAADGLGNYFFYVQSSVCTVAAPCAAQIFGSALTTRVFPDQSYQAASGGGGTGTTQGPFLLENCVPDQTGSTAYSVTSLTNFFFGHYEYVYNPASFPIYFTCTKKLPHSLPSSGSPKIVIDSVSANDNTSGHTMTFQTCDVQVSTSVNVGSLSCAATQNFSTTTTAYAPSTLSFAVQSTLSADAILVVKIQATAISGLATNVLVGNFFLEWQ